MIELNAYGGALSGDCPWYVERREDNQVFDRLANGESCYVRTSHQMGKSSLVVRLVDKIRKTGASSAAIDLAAFGRELSASQWYNALSLRVGHELHLEDEFDTFWAANRGSPPVERFSRSLDCVALRARPGPLIVFVDEADLLRSLPFSPDEFLGIIHSTTDRNDRGSVERNRLVFCLFATVEPTALWRNPRPGQSDLGCIFLLQDFERQELLDVIDGLGRCLLKKTELSVSRWLASAKFVLGEVLDRVFHWTHGHPYLTQKLGCVAAHSISSELTQMSELSPEHCQHLVDCLCEKLFISRIAREQDGHLLWIRHNLLSCGLPLSRVIDLLERARRGIYVGSVDDDEREALLRSGIASVRDGYLQMRNRIYEQVFDEEWLSIRPRMHEASTASSFTPGPTLFTRHFGVLPMPATSGN